MQRHQDVRGEQPPLNVQLSVTSGMKGEVWPRAGHCSCFSMYYFLGVGPRMYSADFWLAPPGLYFCWLISVYRGFAVWPVYRNVVFRCARSPQTLRQQGPVARTGLRILLLFACLPLLCGPRARSVLGTLSALRATKQ